LGDFAERNGERRINGAKIDTAMKGFRVNRHGKRLFYHQHFDSWAHGGAKRKPLDFYWTNDFDEFFNVGN